jgi:hypothetical protein
MTIKTRNELLEGILSEVSGTGAGAAVLSVSGDIVSNADPLNPVVTFPVDITTMLNTRAQLGNTVATDGIITPIVLVGTGLIKRYCRGSHYIQVIPLFCHYIITAVRSYIRDENHSIAHFIN